MSVLIFNSLSVLLSTIVESSFPQAIHLIANHLSPKWVPFAHFAFRVRGGYRFRLPTDHPRSSYERSSTIGGIAEAIRAKLLFVSNLRRPE